MTEFHNLFILSSICLTAVVTYMKPVIGIACPETIPTVSYVQKCPSNETEWRLAAKKKSCQNLSKIQNCTSSENFVYHCVLNKEATMLLEVCAPPWYMSGFCARFSIADQRIVNDPRLDCTKFVQSCPSRFQSNESYKYQMCYKYIGDKKIQEMLKSIQSEKSDSSGTHLAIFFGVIIAVIFLIFLISYKYKWLRLSKPACIRGIHEIEESKLMMRDPEKQNQDAEEKNEENEEERNIANRSSKSEDTLEENTNDETCIMSERQEQSNAENEEQMKFETMSGGKGTCSIKDVTNIYMLREKLSEKLKFPKEIIWVVVKKDGTIYNDETDFEDLKKHQDIIQVVIGNKNRIVQDKCDDSNVESDVISNKTLTSKKCRMSCGHCTAPESLFDYTKNELTKREAVVPCPKCNKKWEMDELVRKCDMSKDEKIFLEELMSLNLMTKMVYQTSMYTKTAPPFV